MTPKLLKGSFSALLLLCFQILAQGPVINEVAWMGTSVSVNDEWVELYNPGDTAINLQGWTLRSTDGTPNIALSGQIAAHGYYLLERTDDTTVPGVTADKIYTGALSNTAENLELRDNNGALRDALSAWHAGNNSSHASMARIKASDSGNLASNWSTETASYGQGFGSPRAKNSAQIDPPTWDDRWYDLRFSDHTNTQIPGAVGPKPMAADLIREINAASSSIDFAVYGFGSVPEVKAALVAAVQRGVTVRGVVDANATGWFAYTGSADLIAALPAGAVLVENEDALMHNKFFVFDNQRIWTGSANVSETGNYFEYNSNWAIVIRNPNLAQAYTTEFAEMYSGKFHTAKTDNTTHVFGPYADGTLIESYFAPTDDATHHAILRAIHEATQKLDIRIFSFTDVEVADAIIAAHNRGVQVRAIMDATGADSEYSQHERLRQAGIPTKVETWAGKEHMKALAVDGLSVILGSQNWTSSGNNSNDENTLYIRNGLLAEAFHQDFNRVWPSIDNRWLTENPGAESADSAGSLSDFIDNDHDDLTDEGAPQQLISVSEAPGAINVYFNKTVLVSPGETQVANSSVNLEERLIHRISEASSSIDVATYEMNLPNLADALIARAAVGVQVRLIMDAKDVTATSLPEDIARYEAFRLTVERIHRGADGLIGTSDDAKVLADSAVFAVEDSVQRQALGLPAVPSDFPYVTVKVGTKTYSGYLLADAERKSGSNYFSAGSQMHNKFMIIDQDWVWTGSFNFTITGIYGSEENRQEGLLGGNSNNAVELRSPELAAIYTTEFEEMWGDSGFYPDPVNANFHNRKSDNTPHHVQIGGRMVDVYFSPGDQAVENATQYLINNADYSAQFCIFAWSAQSMVDALKVKWEGSPYDLEGTRTGFQVEGLFDSSFFNQWWSASVDMRGIEASKTSTLNPNTRWNTPAHVSSDREDRKLHHKYMLIDAGTDSDPSVITGSTNWSANGEDDNDENLLIIHDASIAKQFQQEFQARNYQATGNQP